MPWKGPWPPNFLEKKYKLLITSLNMASQHLQAIFQSACLIIPAGAIAATRNWNQVKRINI
jgi:hypothetical protein